MIKWVPRTRWVQRLLNRYGIEGFEIDLKRIGEAFTAYFTTSEPQALTRQYTAVFEPQPEGGYTALVPALPGCISEGDTLKEARNNIQDAIKLYCESLRADGMPLPEEKDSIIYK